MKTLIICLLFINILFAEDFIPSSDDPNWNYLFSSYEKKTGLGAGIKSENLTTPQFSVSDAILETFLYALPENSNAATAHPEYFPTNDPEIYISEDAEAFVTFYAEGAGYRNTLGYYTYDGDTGRTIPQSRDELKDHGVIIFPNSSKLHSGGMLTYGQTVSLGELSEGTKVIFFIVSNGWKGYGIRNTNWIFSTYSPLNLEYDANSTKTVPDHKHVALLWSNVGAGNILLMGFEDILRTHNGCDHDYNDVLFSFSTSPMVALSSSNGDFQTAPTEVDTDNDGVSDAFDDYPNDPLRAYISQYPSANDTVTLLFEDMWPLEGDYDMNDLTLELHIKEVKDSSALTKEIEFNSVLKASGAAYKNGFAIQIDTPIYNIESSSMTINGVDTSTTIYSDGNNGTIIKFFDDVVAEFKKIDNYSTFSTSTFDSTICNDPYGRFINVCKNRPTVTNPEINISIVFQAPIALASPPYNPFLIVNNGVITYNEVHLPDHMPTSFAPNDLFGTKHDRSNLENGITYKTDEGKPWALLIPTPFAYPIEQDNIGVVYRHYNEWAKSNGNNYKNWYLHNNKDINNIKFADETKIFTSN